MSEDVVSLINAIAMVALLVVTGIYAYLTHKMVKASEKMIEETKKGRERSQIVESTAYIVKILDILEKAPERLEYLIKGNLNSFSFRIPELYSDARSSQILSNITIRSPDLERIIKREYLGVVKSLNEVEKKLDEQLNKSDFNEYCIKLLYKFNGMPDTNNIQNERYNECVKESKEYLKQNGKKMGPTEFIEFFEKCGDEILDLRNEDREIEGIITEISEEGKDAKKTIQKLKSEFQKIKTEFIKDYNLTTWEIEEALKE